jgi:hypothetical protein
MIAEISSHIGIEKFKITYNNALKYALAARRRSLEKPKHSFTSASAARGYSFRVRFSNVLSAKRYL